jgi:WD40 repeat protein
VSKDNSIRVWSLDGKEICGALAERDKNISDVAFSPDGKFLAIAEESGIILSVINVNGKLNIIGKTEVFDFEKITTIAFLPISNSGNIQLLVANEAGEMKSIDVRILIVRKHFEKEYAEQKKKSGLFLPQGEFEKTEDYEKRVATGDIFLEKLDREYMLKYSEITINTDDNSLKTNEKKINLKIENISTYNPDKEIFLIKIQGTEREINIPFADAQLFKKNQSKIVVTALETTTDGKKKITEVTIIDPNTKKPYTFGDLEEKK